MRVVFPSLLTGLRIVFAGAAMSSVAMAQTPPAAPAAPVNPAVQGHALTAEDLQAFFDGILPLQLEHGDAAGATVLVMQNDQVLLKKGYGVADVKKGTPVDPDATLFRVGSISKLPTWIAVMQLVEQGKLDLDTDVNRYLDFEIHPAFGKPITLRNLMTHTGGFEESVTDLILIPPTKQPSLRDYLVRNQPKRIYPPGEVPAYSNYGVGLASYIVQRTSGEPFEQYVAQHIFAPLKMTHSSYVQPLEKGLTASEGYGDSTLKAAIGYELVTPAGAGALASTASDMGRLGTALLHGGELEGARILKPETLKAMWTPQFQANPGLPPICMGFYQEWRNNLKWIGHGGDLIAFHSLFYMEPTQKIVLFVSYNSAGGAGKPRGQLLRAFSDRYFPAFDRPAAVKLTAEQLKPITGTYQVTRRADSTRLKLGNLGSETSVSINKDGELEVSEMKDARDHVIHWQPMGKDLFMNKDGQQRLAVVRDASGKPVRLAIGFPGMQYDRVPWYEDTVFVLGGLVFSLLVVIASVWAFVARIVIRKFFRRRPSPEPAMGTRWLPWYTKTLTLGWLVFAAALGGVLASLGDTSVPSSSWRPWMLGMNVILTVLVVLNVPAAVSAVLIWREEYRWITKVKFTLVGVAVTFLSWFAIHWNLLGQTVRL